MENIHGVKLSTKIAQLVARVIVFNVYRLLTYYCHVLAYMQNGVHGVHCTRTIYAIPTFCYSILHQLAIKYTNSHRVRKTHEMPETEERKRQNIKQTIRESKMERKKHTIIQPSELRKERALRLFILSSSLQFDIAFGPQSARMHCGQNECNAKTESRKTNIAKHERNERES